MVSNATIISMVVAVLLSFGLFIGFILFYKKRVGISVKPLIIGSIGFIVFTQVLEKIVHVVVFTNFPNLVEQPILFGLYGGFAAGIFEELGRFILFTWFLKKYLDYKGGISFGVGWGGIEAVAIMLMVIVPNIVFALLINGGTFESILGSQITADQLTLIKDTVLSQGVGYYVLSIVERFVVIFIQIALTLLVLLGVVRKKFLYVIYAIVIHAVIDFPAALYQAGLIKSIIVIELYLVVLAGLSIWFIERVRKVF